jgi:hypothetical protein
MPQPQQAIKTTFLIWVAAIFVAVAWPSFSHADRAYEIWTISLLVGLPSLSLVLTMVRFRDLNIGMRILGLLPPLFVLIAFFIRLVTK